ncbi:MAG: fibronectin type III domain-containing protein, partial [Candidatus Hydrogenedentes bacterium]|nr:fibronectin type III domain-containing protein [Candidatus Hydrogenedentota bacterium]
MVRQYRISGTFRRTASNLIALAALGLAPAAFATVAEDYTIKASAIVQDSPPQITLTWPSTKGAQPIQVYRKLDEDTTWTQRLKTDLACTATEYRDANVAVGVAYEYMLYQPELRGRPPKRGYVSAGIRVPAVDDCGKIVLIVERSCALVLTDELSRLAQDLMGDGWIVRRHDVGRSDPVTSIRALIQAEYTGDSAHVKAVFLFGHVPVPYSGNLNPDGHSEHRGAWPADAFYGAMNGDWTDRLVNAATAARTENRNIPGDG